ncbi:uncharacterized protein LOC120121928 [Hibiscus syriacus]|uniref:uncharacterized protein LOC120121928 n=1 Tax=Hibiscus syriacus TaxID=106335 RepID=UPI0019228FB4|nr:uncharacterized protein LOC120121928 [Hibiscus syriacus]
MSDRESSRNERRSNRPGGSSNSPALARQAKELKGLGAPEFKGKAEKDLVVADLWLTNVKIMSEGLNCSKVEKLDGIVSLLRGQARIWWKNVTMRLRSDQVTWIFFLEEFKRKYIGDQFIRQIKQEFLNLRQEDYTVFEYECEFNKLSRFTVELIPTQKDTCDWFVEDLRPREKSVMVSQRNKCRGHGRNYYESSTEQDMHPSARVYNLGENEDFEDPEIMEGKFQ